MAREKYNKALVLGHEMRSTLAVIRSLGRSGINVSLGTDRSQKTLCKYSRYVSETVYFSPPRYGIDQFIEGFLKHLDANRYDLIIPTTDVFMIPLVKFRKEVEKKSLLAAPEDNAFYTAYDKFRTIEIARQLGIPIAPSQTIETASSFSQCSENAPFPVVLKPRYSQVLVDDRIHHYSVKIARNVQEYEEILTDYLFATQILQQQFFFGTGQGVEVLCFDGDILVAFQHERLHEPLYGGGSSYRKSVPLNPKLFEYTRRMMMHLKWTGVAMVEFLRDEDSGECVLVEINGRFWGSLPLAIRAGIDFPTYLYQMLVEGRKIFPAGYRSDIYCRNSTNDFWWLYGNIKAPSNDHYLKTVPLFPILKEARNIIAGKEGNDTLTLDDPRPGLSDINDFVHDLYARVRNKLRGRYYRFLEKRGWFDKWVGRSRLIASKGTVKKVLFICKGNICRSPFAAAYMQKISKIKSLSAGYIPRVNRPVPEIALRCGESFGVNLTEHRSGIFNEDMLDGADLIIVMDMENYLELLDTFPGMRNKILFLAWFWKSGNRINIPDPLGHPPEFYQAVYEDIAECLDIFSEFLESKSA